MSIFGDFTDLLSTTADKVIDFKRAESEVQRETTPPFVPEVRQPNDTAPLATTNKNALYLAGAGVGLVALVALVFAVRR
jgi:hypothetical protein